MIFFFANEPFEYVLVFTSRPQEIDEAARRRLVKRLYIPLPEAGAREQIMSSLLSQQKCSLSKQEINNIVQQTHGMTVKWLSSTIRCWHLCCKIWYAVIVLQVIQARIWLTFVEKLLLDL